MNVNELVRTLNAKGHHPKWRAKCPAHKSRGLTLAIYADKGNEIGVHCHAGCTRDDVLDALGLTWKDLKPERDWLPPEAFKALQRKKWEEGKLGRMERREAVLMWLEALEPSDGYKVALRSVTEGIMKHLDGLEPERARMRKFHAAVDRLGWDTIWERFLLTDKGQAALASAEVVR